MAEFHKIEDVGSGEYKVVYRTIKHDIDGNEVTMPCNATIMTEDQIDKAIAQAQQTIINQQKRIADMNAVKAEIAKSKE